ncbi:MAG TPA: PQQ-dependent sugar dehydrogenase [Pyrinomonadaceae bacterium]|nr:PQQ-dependent sugar dehydrogenase [Pyrinomonadaceae bacterium]
MKILILVILTLAALQAYSQVKLAPQRITLKSGKSFTLNVADGFEITPAVEGLKRVRFFAKAPDGRIFVTDMYKLTDNKRGTVYILDGWNERTNKFEKVIPYMTGLRNPNSVQFYRDSSGQDWFYLAQTDKLTRQKFTLGETKPTDTHPQTLATFPDYGLSYKYGGWHLTRTITFGPNGTLYISVGSSCNSCVEKERVRASVIEMNPDGSDQREFARGLRNAVGLKWIGNVLWASNQGSDHLGLEKPDETFYALKDGTDYGWPYCHSSNGRIFPDPVLKRASGCAGVPAPYAYFPAHSSALGFDYFDDADAPATIKNAFLVSLHGSTNKRIGHGYKIVSMRKGERLQDFITGFLQSGQVVGRPCDIMKLDASSFLFTDDHTGIVYLVRKKVSSLRNEGISRVL